MIIRLVNYVPADTPDAAPLLGAIKDDGIVDLREVCKAAAAQCACDGSLVDVLASELCLGKIREHLPNLPATLPLERARLLSPVLRPGKLLCIARNYEEHVREGGADVHPSDLATPRYFMKPTPNTVCGPDDPILIAKSSHFVDYEGELAVIIGKRGKYIPSAQALQYVAGATCLNDVSERSFHLWDRRDDREIDRFFDWLNGKWYDNSAPMGPCAVPLDDLGDLQDLRLMTRVNGETVQDESTAAMIFTVPKLIEYISQVVTLEPGDVIATGTPAGVGKARGAALQPGDVVEVEVEKIGTLRNPVIAEA